MPEEKEAAKTAAEETGAANAAEESAGAPAKSSGVLPLIIIGVALIVVSAAVTFFVVKMTIPSALKSAPKSVSVGPVVVPIKDVLVNITDTKGTRMLKIAPHLVVSEEALAEIIRKSEAMVRDRIGTVAGKMSLDALEGVKGRSILKNDIISQLNDDFKDKMAGTVTDVYFAEYLFQ